MTPDITRYLNKTVYVSIPALFEDGTCRACTLVGAELNGLWLQSDQLIRRLLPGDKEDLVAQVPAIFVPFAQIAGVLVSIGMPPQKPAEKPPQKPEQAVDQAGAGKTKRKAGNG